MRRYIEAVGLGHALDELYRSGPAFDLLAESAEIAGWASDGAAVSVVRNDDDALDVRSESNAVAGVVFKLPPDKPASFSGGVLELRYRSSQSIDKVDIIPKRGEPLPPGVIQNEISATFEATGDREETLLIPLPTTPGLDGIAAVELNFKAGRDASPNTFVITEFKFTPLTD
jgi:hypothetical protein